MSIHLTDGVTDGLPQEPRLLREVGVRLIEPAEQGRFDELLAREHYLKNATVVGQALRYVAEYQGQWLALLVFSSAAFHIKPRDRWLHWSARQVEQRRHLLAQNQRFLVLAAPGRWPNLASRILKLTCERLAQDWQQHFGHPVLAVETFVDPQRFRGTCYKAAGWERLGATQGCQRDWQDFYTDTQHPKEIWVRALHASALEQLRADELPAPLAEHERPLPPACPVATDQLPSLWECFRDRLTDPRKPKGKRHQLATVLTLIALAVAAGCKNPHALAEFARSLNHGQRRHLRCRPRAGTRRQCDVPSERTFRRLLKAVAADALKEVLVAWMAQQDPRPAEVLHLDGKVVKNARPAPACAKAKEPETEIPVEQQKPKADQALTLVNFVTGHQRLVEQVAVPRNTNEEAAVAAHLPEMDLAGLCLTADAAHTTRANARQVTQGNGADYLMSLKGNQPHALAKARQLLTGAFPPAARTVEKNHGRIEERALWVCQVAPQTLGLAGAAQLVRMERKVDEVRAGQVIKHTEEIAYEVSSLWPDEAGPEQLLQRVRDKWKIENGQHYRRDRTQDEDRCTVGETNSARLLSLFRSLAIFLHEQQRRKPEGRKSLPDFERRVCQQPGAMIRRFMSAPS